MRTAFITAVTVVGMSISSAGFQASPSLRVYRSQYAELKSKAVSLLDRATESRSNARALREEQLALLKLVHRLEEQTMADNGERTGRSQPSDKGLLLVWQACNALDFVLAATDNYIDSGDGSFLQLARQGMALAESVERLF
jgi:hypothetical protein